MSIRMMLWVFAFLLPALSFGTALPHSIYILIPALVAVDGLSGNGSLRRFLVWVGLVLLYEMVYQLPLGMFVVPVVIVSMIHVASARLVSIDGRRLSERSGAMFLVRALVVAVAWTGGLVVLSSAMAEILGSGSPEFWQSIVLVWWYQRVAVAGGVLTGLAILLLSGERVNMTNRERFGYGILQTEQNISR